MGGEPSQYRGLFISLCPDLPLNLVGVSPEACDVLAAPLLDLQTGFFVCTAGQNHDVTATGKGRGVKRRALLNLSIFCSSWSTFFLRLSGWDGDSEWLCQLGAQC